MTTIRAQWGKHSVILTWVKSSELPEDLSVTSTHGFCFYNDKAILVKLDSRGWDIPGGHMESGETPEECFAREAMEEACISGDAKLIGYCLVDNREDPHFIPGKYPEIGVQAFYRMNVTDLLPFETEFEASARLLVEPSDVSVHHENWNPLIEEILAEALKN